MSTDTEPDIDPALDAHLRRTLREVAATVTERTDANVVHLVTAPPPSRRRAWRRPALIASAAVLVLVASFGLSILRTEDGRRLAYALEAGDDLTYSFSNDYSTTQRPTGPLPDGVTLGEDVQGRMRGELRLMVGEGPTMDTLTIELSATGLAQENVGGVVLPIASAWPKITFVVRPDGEVIEQHWDDDESGSWIPSVLLTDPTFGDAQTVLPISFGPPLPEEPVEVGDSWTTTGAVKPPCGQNRCEPIVGRHEVVGEERLDGRDVIVIESSYSRSLHAQVVGADDYSNETTIWVDPDDAIIVKGSWEETMRFDIEFRPGAEQVVEQRERFSFELING